MFPRQVTVLVYSSCGFLNLGNVTEDGQCHTFLQLLTSFCQSSLQQSCRNTTDKADTMDNSCKDGECMNRWYNTLRENFERMLANKDVDEDMIHRGSEGKLVDRLSWSGNTIAVFTSGGDSQGMNAAVRAIARMGMFLGCRVFYIKEGYEGMIEGGDHFEEATMHSTSNIINMGGTFIGSARSMEFKKREGRLKAAKNLIEKGINNIIVIGGDGSLTGANCFRQEWASLIRELKDTGRIPRSIPDHLNHLNLVGIVGSIDNDFCGTEVTLGSNSALHRILESCDDILTTAVSHKRAFVLEVMGRMCGYLPLVGGLAAEASAIFIPENPPPGDWKNYICRRLKDLSEGGEVRRTHIVLVAEGAMDREHVPIKSSDVQKVLTERMNMDVRVTVLGHIQRGGTTSAFDRIIGSRKGVEAVIALKDATPSTPPYVIGMQFNTIVRVPLMKAVEKTRRAGQLLETGDYDEVVKLRGRSVSYPMYVHQLLNQADTLNRSSRTIRKKPLRVAMVHVGEPACGMNSTARAFVRICDTYGYIPLFIYNSWHGLIDDKVQVMHRNDVHLWTGKGGSQLGTSLATLDDAKPDKVALKIAEHKISGLIIVGGFEAFKSACELEESRKTYKEFCIPVVVIPATSDNNVPGNDFSLGCDTAVNQICKACDDLKHSALSLKKCVYVVEVGGHNCGCLATLAGIATGADRAFIREEPFTIKDLKDTCMMLKTKLETSGVKHGLILRNENANPNLTTDFIYRLLNEEGKPHFYARKSVLGNTQQSSSSSPYDRYTGLKISTRSTLWMIQTMENCGALEGNVFTDSHDTVVVSSMQNGVISMKTIEALKPQTDFKYCVPKHNWWLELRPLFRIFTQYQNPKS